LSGRELEVLALLASGKTNREAAGELYVAEGTVKATSRASTASWGCETAPPCSTALGPWAFSVTPAPNNLV
jgi:hypothetical protein